MSALTLLLLGLTTAIMLVVFLLFGYAVYFTLTRKGGHK